MGSRAGRVGIAADRRAADAADCAPGDESADHDRGPRRGRARRRWSRGCVAALRERGIDARAAARAGRRRACRARPRAGQGPGAARRRAGRGAALRRGAGPARRGGACEPLLDARRVGAARPLRRLVAGLPGRRARARRRRRARDQRVRHRRPAARPHAAAAHRPGAAGARARPAAARRPTGSSARPTPSSARIAAAYDELAAAEPERIRVLDATLPPDAVLSGALDAMADLL